MKQFLAQATMFILLLGLPLLAVEMSLRSQKELPVWFDGYTEEMRHENADVVFLGNSVIAAAVRKEKFAELISLPGKAPRRVVNLGEGYTTPVEYLFGLRHWLEANPHVFENCTLVMPAPGGLPDFRTWKDDWMAWQEPQLLARYIKFPEIWTYCTTVDVPLGEKCLLIGAKLSSTVSQGGLLRVAIMHQFDLLAEYLTTGGRIAHHKANVVTEGGILNDEQFMEYMRQLTIKVEKGRLQNQQPIDWSQCVIKDIASFMHEHGGRLCFCCLPVSTVQQVPLNTPIRQADMKNFEASAAEWGCVILKPDYRTKGDGAFPDLTHMDIDSSYGYTKALAEVFPFK